MTKYLYDEDTGEATKIAENETIMKIKFSYFHLKNMEKTLFYRLSVNANEFFKSDDVKPCLKRTLFKLFSLLELNKGEILKLNGLPANITQISHAIGVSYRTLSSHLGQLEVYRILKKIKNGRDVYVYMNPYFVSYGNYYYEESLQIFGNTQWVCKYNKKNKYDRIIQGGN